MWFVLLAFAAVGCLLLGGGVTKIVPRPGDPQKKLSTPITPALIEKGAYLARVGDCVACHSMPGKSDFSGGMPIASPIGGMVPPNITSDINAGIGSYSFGDFDRAVRFGIAKDGETLYPAMPWTSYSRISVNDMEALYAYFMRGVPPVSAPSQANTIPWPLSMRWPMTYWRWLFAPKVPPPIQAAPSDPISLGAYYVQGLGHCGACHTPRALTLQESAFDDIGSVGNKYLAGGQVIDGYYVPSLRGELVSGLGNTKSGEIIELLKTGRTNKTAAFGPMSDVVTNSTQYMTKGDLSAIASYLKSLPARVNQDKPYYDMKTYEELSEGILTHAGASVYMKNCEGCHLSNGLGYSKKFSSLALNSSVNSPGADGLIRIVLSGETHAKTQVQGIPSYYMPSFAKSLSDQEIADVLTFIRSSWGNNATAVTASDVAESRKNMQKSPPM
ncbi:alcohol dehydrogenase [Serratia marcescens]|nr:alcohol dehydrogenase [Serratia marcescens]